MRTKIQALSLARKVNREHGWMATPSCVERTADGTWHVEAVWIGHGIVDVWSAEQ